MDSKAMAVYDKILEEICTELVFQTEIEMSLISAIDYKSKDDLDVISTNRCDIFNISNSKESHECICVICGRTVGALRFAPHLEKCLGMGRVSSRIATRRLATGSIKENSNKIIDDNDNGSLINDTEWTVPKQRSRTDRKRKDRSKRVKPKKPEETPVNNDDYKYSSMSMEEKHNMLGHLCGVVSEHTGRMCTRSVRCPKHTEEQRNSVRLNVLWNEDINTGFNKLNVQEGKHVQEGNKKEQTKNTEITELQVPVTPTKRSERHRVK